MTEPEPPDPKILQFKSRKSSEKSSEGKGRSFRYDAGEQLLCKVVKDEPGGYEVLIIKNKEPGFLPTQALLKPGEEISAQFVCVHNQRVLLSARFSNSRSIKAPARKTVRWEERVDELDETAVESDESSDKIKDNVRSLFPKPKDGEDDREDS